MEQLRNAANAAASYVGLGTNEEARVGDASHISGGEAPQNVTTSTTQSGVEPVSGQLGRGNAGEPYDAGNEDGAAGLGGSAAQNLSGSQSATGQHTGTGLGTSGTPGTGLTSNTHSSNTSSEPLGEKVRETFGIGGSDKHGTGLSDRHEGPGYGTASKNDKDSSRLGSAVGHGSNPDRYLYDSKSAPGMGGHRLGGDDDFTDSNTRHEGADSLPSASGSDTAAGHAKHNEGGISSNTGTSSNRGTGSGIGSGLAAAGAAVGLTSGQSGHREHNPHHYHGENHHHDRYDTTTGRPFNSGTDRTGESLIEKAKDYLPGTTGNTGRSGTSGTTSSTGETLARKAEEYLPGTTGSSNTRETGLGRNEPGHGSQTTHDSSSLPIRSGHDSSLTGAGVGSGLTGSSTTGSGLTGEHTHGAHGHHGHGIADLGSDPEHEGYRPHGGHPIGAAAHQTEDGKQTWLDYRNDPNLPVARANPADQ